VQRASWDLNLEPPTPRKPKPPKAEMKKGEEAERARVRRGPRASGRYRARLVGERVRGELDVVSNPAAGIDDADLGPSSR
jgi:hypothetical protein